MAKSEQNWEVYIVRASCGRLYTGISTDVLRRFAEHKGSKRGARFFNSAKAEAIVYRESQPDRAVASRREYQIKKMSRQEKLELIATWESESS